MSNAAKYSQLQDHYDQVLARIYQALHVRTQIELARILHVRQSTVSDSRRRRHIPEKWLLKLVMQYNLNPRWLIKGEGAKYLAPVDQGPPDIATLLSGVEAGAFLQAIALRMNRPDLIVVQKESAQQGAEPDKELSL